MNDITFQQFDDLITKRLKKLRKNIKEDIDEAVMNVFQAADSNKADKSVVKELDTRVTVIERIVGIAPKQ